jgi:Lrp/AsnC family leucine-responsive transcriptional regulator
MAKVPLDPIDQKILMILQEQGRITNAELADEVGLTPSPCFRRVKHLEEVGVIRGYVALLDSEKVGRDMHAFVEVSLDKQTKNGVDLFNEEIRKLPEVLECYLMAGDYDYLLRVAVEDLMAFHRFLMEHLTRIRGVTNIKSRITIKQIKSTTKLPLT